MLIYRCAQAGSQFFIVTHSPILLGIPDADIYCFDCGSIHLCEYEETDNMKWRGGNKKSNSPQLFNRGFTIILWVEIKIHSIVGLPQTNKEGYLWIE